MKKTLLGILAVAAMLSFTLSAQAVPQLDRAAKSMPTINETASGQAPNAGSIDDDCTTGGFPLGTITRFTTIPANTTGLVNNFGCDADLACTTPCAGYAGDCYYYGGAAPDGVAVFQVPVTGTWRFATCGGPIVDSSLSVRTSGVCPGAACVAQDDDSCASCGPPFEARLTATLTAGQDYYLIVDGWGGGSVGDVSMLVTGPCAVPADCNDSIFCNGVELCTAGMCAAGANPCTGSTPLCDEGTDTCSGCASNPGACVDDALFCNGPGVCLPSGACGQGGNPCASFQTCNETTNACVDPDPCVAWRTLGDLNTAGVSPQCFNSCSGQVPGTRPPADPNGAGGGYQSDDIQLSAHAGRELVRYQTLTVGRDVGASPSCTNGAVPPIAHINPLGSPYIATTELWTAASAGVCTPDALLPGTRCNFNPAGVVQAGGLQSSNLLVCQPAGGAPTGILIPDGDDDPVLGQCGIDVYLMLQFNIDGGSFCITQGPPQITEQVIGGPALDDEFGQSVFANEDCDVNGHPLGTWAFGAFAAPTGSDFRRTEFCTVPVGPCCDGAGGCNVLDEAACTAGGGVYLGDNELGSPNTCDSPDGDGDDVRDECDGCPLDGTKTQPGQCGCGNPDTDTDGDGTADCNDGCPLDPGKIAPGICGCGNPDTDSDGDGTADCQDQCPNDPNKVAPGICGCGVAETGDSDGDGVSDCVDQCPGVDDAVFFPGCVGAIPTVSEWGMVVLALLLLAGAKVYFGRRTVQA